jgi:hypothetical protein
MKNEKINALRVWKQFEDVVAPQLKFSAVDYCNAQKGEEEAGNFLRKLYREERLTLEELNGRLGALKELAAGKLRPALG